MRFLNLLFVILCLTTLAAFAKPITNDKSQSTVAEDGTDLFGVKLTKDQTQMVEAVDEIISIVEKVNDTSRRSKRRRSRFFRDWPQTLSRNFKLRLKKPLRTTRQRTNNL
ncbi:hypothetical protein L596_010667 [Steinernema carpocapsae]|uniref:SXP/RAL-2 family protein Ani s 5-like cation-binding domain-containing protein n=1 Tax=Steinernema carpocapsae TaxID=34508 RepID=A0A4U5PKP2_STECR|nr:hypothetical protein L596_010667 [Steinernema carpocapsae]